MTQAIIYSPSNFDSCLASAIMLTHLRNNDLEVKSFIYNRGGNSFEPPVGFSSVYILGADLTADDMLAVIVASPDSVYHLYNYSNSTVYPDKILNYNNESHQLKSYPNVADDGYKISIASRVCSDIQGSDKMSDDFGLVKKYAGATSLYMNFLPMTASEMLFLFSNFKNVKNAATGTEDLLLVDESPLTDKKQYDEYVQDIRQLVKANMAMAYYPGANGSGFQTPTICVGEKDSLHAMRFINYAHDDVISYEDTRSARIYRILSKKNLHWYIKRFDPRDIWSEGHLTYFKTELQQHVR